MLGPQGVKTAPLRWSRAVPQTFPPGPCPIPESQPGYNDLVGAGGAAAVGGEVLSVKPVWWEQCAETVVERWVSIWDLAVPVHGRCPVLLPGKYLEAVGRGTLGARLASAWTD